MVPDDIALENAALDMHDGGEPGGAQRPSGTQTLERGLDLLGRVAESPIRMADLIAFSGLTKTTAWRLVNTLIQRKLIFLNDRGELQGGTELLHLGMLAQQHLDVVAVARPRLDDLAAHTSITAFLGRREDRQSVHLYRSATMQRVMVATPVGTRRPLAETSMGKALMLDDGPAGWRAAFAQDGDPERRVAEMAGHAAAGHVLNQGGPPDYINAIAAPVRDARGTIAAAISVASPAQYLDLDRMRLLAAAVTRCAADISGDLGFKA